jgi:hypothetical protein
MMDSTPITDHRLPFTDYRLPITAHCPLCTVAPTGLGKPGNPLKWMARMDRDLTQVRPARVTRITAEDRLTAGISATPPTLGMTCGLVTRPTDIEGKIQ